MGWVFWLRFVGPQNGAAENYALPPPGHFGLLARCGLAGLAALADWTGWAGCAGQGWDGPAGPCCAGLGRQVATVYGGGRSPGELIGSNRTSSRKYINLVGGPVGRQVGWASEVGECRASMRATKYEQMTICDDLTYPVHTPTLGSELGCGGLV